MTTLLPAYIPASASLRYAGTWNMQSHVHWNEAHAIACTLERGSCNRMYAGRLMQSQTCNVGLDGPDCIGVAWQLRHCHLGYLEVRAITYSPHRMEQVAYLQAVPEYT